MNTKPSQRFTALAISTLTALAAASPALALAPPPTGGSPLVDICHFTGQRLDMPELYAHGFGDPDSPLYGCPPGPGYVTNADDCDDDNASMGNVCVNLFGLVDSELVSIDPDTGAAAVYATPALTSTASAPAPSVLLPDVPKARHS